MAHQHIDEENPKKTQRTCYKENKINDNMDARRSKWCQMGDHTI
jgi:hypothetical protein